MAGGAEFSPLVQRESLHDGAYGAYEADQVRNKLARKRRRWCSCCACLLAAAATALLLVAVVPLPGPQTVSTSDPPTPTGVRRRQPHLVYVLLDDVGWADYGWSASPAAPRQPSMTPQMDRLSATGIRLSRFYTHSMCTATRGALLTGRYAFRLGLQHWVLTKSDEWSLPREEVTLAERLSDAGYSSHMLGKW